MIFYCACTEIAVCESSVKISDHKFVFIVLDVLKDVKNVEFDGRLRPFWPFIYCACDENGLTFDPRIEFPTSDFL